jgi:hypothetical protein
VDTKIKERKIRTKTKFWENGGKEDSLPEHRDGKHSEPHQWQLQALCDTLHCSAEMEGLT